MQVNFLGLTLFIPATISGLLALNALRHRRTPSAIPLAFLMLALMLWSIVYALELFSSNLQAILFFAAFEYACISLVPILWLLLVLDFIGHQHWLTRGRLLALLFIPLITQILYTTNSYHHWFHATQQLVNVNGITILSLTYGPWHRIFVAYAYLILGIGMILVARQIWRASPIVQRQAMILLGGSAVPVVVNVSYLLGVRPFGVLDPTSFAFTISGVIIAWGISRFQLLDLKPLAREVLIEKLRDGIFVLDERQRIVDMNPAAAEMLGLNTLAVIGRTVDAVLDNVEIVTLCRSEIETQQEIQRAETNLEIRVMPLFDSMRQHIGGLVTLYNVTDRKRGEEALRESEEKHRLLIENSHDIIYTINADGTFTFVSPAWITLLGHPVTRVIGKSFQQFVHPEDIPRCMVFLQSVIETGQRQEGVEYRVQHVDGTWYWHTSSAVPFKDANGTIAGFYGIAHDITKRRHTEEELRHTQESLEQTNQELQHALAREQHLARTDTLTGVSNRLRFFEFAEHEFQVAARYQRPLSIIMLDVDHFKQVNDTFGHDAGDQTLTQIAHTAQAQLRSPDMLARYGGEEFVALLPATDAAQAGIVAERIRAHVAALVVEAEHGTAQVTVSIGIASMIPTDDSIDQVIKRADQALYRAKEAGRNRIEVEPATL